MKYTQHFQSLTSSQNVKKKQHKITLKKNKWKKNEEEEKNKK